MELFFLALLGGIVTINGALVVYILGNIYIIPHYFPQFHQLGFGESIIIIVVSLFLMITLFGNDISAKKRDKKTLEKKKSIPFYYDEKAK